MLKSSLTPKAALAVLFAAAALVCGYLVTQSETFGPLLRGAGFHDLQLPLAKSPSGPTMSPTLNKSLGMGPPCYTTPTQEDGRPVVTCGTSAGQR